MDRVMTILLRHFPLGGIILGVVHRSDGPVDRWWWSLGSAWRWSGVASTTSTTSLNGVAQRDLGDGRAMMDSRRVVVLSDSVATSMVGLARFFASVYTLDMVWRKMAVATSEVYA